MSTVITSTTAAAPTWIRPVAGEPPTSLGSGTRPTYRVIPFSVSESGEYDFTNTASWDLYAFLYANSFNPEDALADVAIGADTSEFAATLTAGAEYFLVITGILSDDAGEFFSEISGPGVVFLGTDLGSCPSVLYRYKYGTARATTPRWRQSKTARGLQQVQTNRTEINPFDREFRPQYTGLTPAQATEIDTFLQNRLDRNEVFAWKPESYPLDLFRCESWSVTYESCRSASVETTFTLELPTGGDVFPGSGPPPTPVTDLRPLVSADGSTRFRIISVEYRTGLSCGDTPFTPGGYPSDWITGDIEAVEAVTASSNSCGPTQIDLRWISRTTGQQSGSGFSFIVNGNGVTRIKMVLETEVLSGEPTQIEAIALEVFAP